MGCPFDDKCKFYNKGEGTRNKCLTLCDKWECSLNKPITSSLTVKIDITEIPTKRSAYVLAIIRTLPEKQATILIQKNYLNYTHLQIKEYHGFKSESAVSNIIKRATESILAKLKRHH